MVIRRYYGDDREAYLKMLLALIGRSERGPTTRCSTRPTYPQRAAAAPEPDGTPPGLEDHTDDSP